MAENCGFLLKFEFIVPFFAPENFNTKITKLETLK